MDRQDPKLREIWLQKKIPVVYRQEKSKPLLVRLPYAADNRRWLKNEHRKKPKWDAKRKRWESPRSWFEDLIKRALSQFGCVYVIQSFKTQQKCAPACWNATGFDCECSCMGANHGSGDPSGRWYVISETLAVNWGEQQYSCRLVTSPGIQQPSS